MCGITVNVSFIFPKQVRKFITHYSLLITHYSLLITHYSLLITRNTNTRNFDAFYIITIKFLKSPACNFQTFQSGPRDSVGHLYAYLSPQPGICSCVFTRGRAFVNIGLLPPGICRSQRKDRGHKFPLLYAKMDDY